MPNRILKETIKNSPEIDQLNWFEEVVFYRLIVSADDYGCFDGRATVLKNTLFPTKDNITKSAIENAISKMARLGLVRPYEVDGRPYLFLPTWKLHQRVRNKNRKYPLPPAETDLTADCGQLTANCCQTSANSGLNPIQSESESESESKSARARQGDVFFGHNFSPPMQEKLLEWLAYKKERRQTYTPTGQKSLMGQVANRLTKHDEKQIIDLISECMANGWQGIIWDKLKSPDPPANAVRARKEPHDDGTTWI